MLNQAEIRAFSRCIEILASLHVSKNRFFLAVLFEWLFFFADSRRKRGFQPVKSPYFCVGQKKKNELLEKNQ